MDMWQGVKSAAGREVMAPGQILWEKQFRFHNSQLKKEQKTTCTNQLSGSCSNRPSDSWMVKAILPFWAWAFWSFLRRMAPKQTFCWSQGELMNRRSSWREFGFNPVVCHPLIVHTLERTSKLWATSLALSARFFWAPPSEVYYVLRPSTWFVLFQPWGLYRATWNSSLSLYVRLSTLPLLCIMSSASPASVFCG